jgi:seryl-tRNA(Sec) selenium transferase
MNVYQQLDVRTLINAAGDFTRFGGTLMDPRVIRAMEGAAGSFVDLLELQRRAGARIVGNGCLPDRR